ncbi:(Fe-S)-binding protein [Campylobacter sp. VBCF_05 NA6]|uniref:(Fe-S)-binding protein n=1 Tax=unclassified Campylobacter TaxID=2593542 RepID=UPI0022EA0F11|nr:MULTISPECIES: (Fe-S)-binding protein [unclassified Campylobacter]MDA3058395.1 (Fe-S)-binding protein [Campylobacter sp. VBCF_04 NA7]MDA3059939.1 (Fe-S)-binding protein [Campylobacter sp. VBCF_05 NA6]
MYDFKTLSDKCVKCGKCIPACTIHNINSDEVTSPRGFLDLLGAVERGELELDKNMKNIFESCFLCTSCVDVCNDSLPTDTAIENARYKIAQRFGIAWYKRAVFWFLSHRKILDLAARLGYFFVPCAFKTQKDSERGNTMRPRFSVPMMSVERTLPSLAKKSFMNSHAEFIDNGGSKTIGLFIGCMGNYAYTGIGEAFLKIAKSLNLNVNLMKKQACCGAPQYFTGDFGSVEKNAKFNIEYFEKMLANLDAIVVPEATCSGMLKVDYVHFFEGDSHWQERAKAVASKIYLATEYFDKFTNLKEILSERGKIGQITYHDPCHSRKMQGIWREPRNLLSQNYEIIEMPNANQCCGFGGVTMQSEKYHLSRKAGLDKVASLKDSPLKIVSAECSACRMQLNNAFGLAQIDMKCVNPLELIARALG